MCVCGLLVITKRTEFRSSRQQFTEKGRNNTTRFFLTLARGKERKKSSNVKAHTHAAEEKKNIIKEITASCGPFFLYLIVHRFRNRHDAGRPGIHDRVAAGRVLDDDRLLARLLPLLLLLLAGLVYARRLLLLLLVLLDRGAGQRFRAANARLDQLRLLGHGERAPVRQRGRGQRDPVVVHVEHRLWTAGRINQLHWFILWHIRRRYDVVVVRVAAQYDVPAAADVRRLLRRDVERRRRRMLVVLLAANDGSAATAARRHHDLLANDVDGSAASAAGCTPRGNHRCWVRVTLQLMMMLLLLLLLSALLVAVPLSL